MNRALLVGIEAYCLPNPAEPLRGCLNDVRGLYDALTNVAGFVQNDIRVITDQQATARNIRENLQQLVAGITPGDRIVFHYSGHGSRFPIGQEVHDVIIPYDFTLPATPADVVADVDFAQVFSAIPDGARAVWTCDACTSGGLIRVFEQSRYYKPPVELLQEAAKLQQAGQSTSFTSEVQVARNFTMFAACGVGEVATGLPINGVDHGLFSYFLVSLLADPQTRSESAQLLVSTITGDLQQQGVSWQHPELHGDESTFGEPFLPGLRQGLTTKLLKAFPKKPSLQFRVPEDRSRTAD